MRKFKYFMFAALLAFAGCIMQGHLPRSRDKKEVDEAPYESYNDFL